MCGIAGYIGSGANGPGVVVDALIRLEYRGYDSAGFACLESDGQSIRVFKTEGTPQNLRPLLDKEGTQLMQSRVAIGHNRWATHGLPTTMNAHPHTDCSGKIAICHNGIIENYRDLRAWLTEWGHELKSDTDTEVIPHLIEHELQQSPGNLLQAVRRALGRLRGKYALCVLSVYAPDTLIVARHASPMVIGVGSEDYWVASDATPLLAHTRQMIYLEDGDIALLAPSGLHITDVHGHPVMREVQEISWDIESAAKDGHPHFMRKEIYEQPDVFRQTIAGRISNEATMLDLSFDPLLIDQVHLIACGTAYYAGCYAKYLIEKIARIPCEVRVASEYRYADPVVTPKTLAIAITQSGETIDTLEGIREAKQRGARTLGVLNAKGSTIAREVDHQLYIHAGPEIGVASTKAYTAMLGAFALLALWFAEARQMIQPETLSALRRELLDLPDKITRALGEHPDVRRVAQTYHQATNFLFLGRQMQAVTASEGALKLKEISYAHAEGYPAGEMKHGPIALVDAHLPVVVLATRDDQYEKVLSNIQEVRARRGRVIAVATLGDDEVREFAHDVLWVPDTHPFFAPVVSIIALQLLAYEVAVALGRNVDQPRNLAKSVTVE